MTSTLQSRSLRWEDVAAACLILLIAVLIVVYAIGRQYLNVNTETDFISGFQPEAARFLAGEPFLLEFHPPGYPVALATLQPAVGDWFAAGLFISALAAIAVLVSSYACFRELFGPCAGLGALAALAGSAVFMEYSVQATSDVYFLALWTLALWLVVLAMRQQRVWQWCLAGLLIAGAVLSRTNGVVLLMLLIAPLISGHTLRAGARNCAVLTVAVAGPLLLWLYYARSVGSPFMPTQTHANLALTYFADGSRISADSLVLLRSQFTSSLDVVLADPQRVARIYLHDLMGLPGKLLRRMTWPPLAALSLVCAVAWLAKLKDRRALLVLALTLGSVALLNMKAFEARYFLLLVPVAGASIGMAAAWLAGRFEHVERATRAAAVGLTALTALAFAAAGYAGFARAEEPALTAEFREIVAAIEDNAPDNALIVCRKCNAAYHSGRANAGFFPDVQDLRQLCGYLESLDRDRPTYLVIATMERKLRPEISTTLLSDPLPSWLEVTAEGTGSAPWRLIRYRNGTSCRGQ